MSFNSQPTLESEQFLLRPMVQSDYAALYECGSDPLIWQQHHESDRHDAEAFKAWFERYLPLQASLVVEDKRTGKVIGTSSFYMYDSERSEVGIGSTFITRDYWGGGANRAIKDLMIKHAFKSVTTVLFHVATTNIRSQKAVEKLGAKRTGEIEHKGQPYVCFSLAESDYKVLQ